MPLSSSQTDTFKNSQFISFPAIQYKNGGYYNPILISFYKKLYKTKNFSTQTIGHNKANKKGAKGMQIGCKIAENFIDEYPNDHNFDILKVSLKR